MIVVDTNVLAYALLQGLHTPLARAVLQRDPLWVLPPLWAHEFLNVLAVHHRAGGLSTEDAQRLWRQAFQLFAEREHPVDMATVLHLALAHAISAYDAEYIALAHHLHLRCVTEDKALLRVFPKVAVSMRTFCQG